MRSILVVDDIPDYVDAIEGFLFDEYNVLKAFGIDDAKELIKKEKVDAAIIDVRLNEEDEENKEGLDLLEWIKENYPEIPVVMMSAYREFEYAVEALNKGAEYFLRKPLKPNEIKEVLRKLLGEHND